MKVFKFGGASIRDFSNIQKVLTVLETSGETNLVIVVSAMGKMTNALEKVVEDYFRTGISDSALQEVASFHLKLLDTLFPEISHPIHAEVKKLLSEIETFLDTNKSKNHSFVYDQVVCYGELISSRIISAYLSEKGYSNSWLDVRECIITDDSYRDAKVDWEQTENRISNKIAPSGITITQGFLGSESVGGFSTTLGREGSDYTAAIFAYCLNAESVTIWKDVPGVLNADPRYFSKTQLLSHISYREAIELAFYGASVIHPKTLQPLQQKGIPLYVRSFLSPMDKGTIVSHGPALEPKTSCFILKKNLTLISLSSLDFSFMMEDNIGDVFKLLHQHKMKVELIQNSAISFSVCVSDKYNCLPQLLEKLRENFRVKWNENVTLYTIRHFDPLEIKMLRKNKVVLLKQETQETVQLVIKE